MKCTLRVILFFAFPTLFEASGFSRIRPTSSQPDEEDVLFRSLARKIGEIPKAAMQSSVKIHSLPSFSELLQSLSPLENKTGTHSMHVPSDITNVPASRCHQASGQTASKSIPGNDAQVELVTFAITKGDLVTLEAFIKHTDLWPGEHGISLAAENGHLHIVEWLYDNDSRFLPSLLSLERTIARKHFNVWNWYWSLAIERPTFDQLIRDGMYFSAEWCFFNKQARSPYKGIIGDILKDGNTEFLDWVFTKIESSIFDENSIHLTKKQDLVETLRWMASNAPRLFCAPVLIHRLKDKNYYDAFIKFAKFGKPDDWIPTQSDLDRHSQQSDVLLFKWLLKRSFGLAINQSQLYWIAKNSRAHLLHIFNEYLRLPLPDIAAIDELYCAGKLESIKVLYAKIDGYSVSPKNFADAVANSHYSILEFVEAQSKTNEKKKALPIAMQGVVRDAALDRVWDAVRNEAFVSGSNTLARSSLKLHQQHQDIEPYSQGPRIINLPQISTINPQSEKFFPRLQSPLHKELQSENFLPRLQSPLHKELQSENFLPRPQSRPQKELKSKNFLPSSQSRPQKELKSKNSLPSPQAQQHQRSQDSRSHSQGRLITNPPQANTRQPQSDRLFPNFQVTLGQRPILLPNDIYNDIS